MTFEDLQKANAAISSMTFSRYDKKAGKTVNKEYAEVNQRIKAFRMCYPEGTIYTEMLSCENGVCIFKAMVSANGDRTINSLLGVGHAYEKEGSSSINQTSYIENCETSAVGRALGMAGFGIDTSVASYEEVQNAILNQEKAAEKTEVQKNPEPEKPETAVKRSEKDHRKDHMDALDLIMAELGTKESELCKYFEVEALPDLSDDQIIQAINILSLRKEKRNAAGGSK